MLNCDLKGHTKKDSQRGESEIIPKQAAQKWDFWSIQCHNFIRKVDDAKFILQQHLFNSWIEVKANIWWR